MAAGSVRYATGYVDLILNTRLYDRELMRVQLDLNRITNRPWTIVLQLNRGGATSALNLYMQQLRAAQALARTVTLGGGGAGGGGRGAGGGRGGSGGSFGGGFAQGALGGLGIPAFGSPAAMAGQVIGRGLIDGIASSVKTFAELESKLVDIRRVAGFSADELKTFKDSIMSLSTSMKGVKLKDLLEIGEVGAQAGVTDREGVTGLSNFTRDMAKVRMAMGNVPTEELATNILRVLTVFGEGTNKVAGFGSALAQMANVSLATSQDILDISQRLSGTAASIRLTIPQVLALSSVLKDVGLSNEIAGSAFSQIFRRMATDSKNFAESIGVDATKFADAYKRDPMEALGMVIARFKEFKDTISGQEFLKTLGLTGVRTAGALQQLGTAFERIAPRTAMAAQETGTEAALEASVGLESSKLQSGFDQLDNATTALKGAFGETLAPAAGRLAGAMTRYAMLLRGEDPDAKPVPSVKQAAMLTKHAVDALPPENLDAAVKARAQARAVQMMSEQNIPRLEESLGVAQRGGNERAIEQAERALIAGQNEQAKAAKAMADADTALAKIREDLAKVAAPKLIGNFIFEAANKGLGVLGAVQEGKQALFGAAGRAGNQLAGALMPDQQQGPMQLSSGLSGMDVGRRIQEDILNMSKEKDAASEKTATNTANAVVALGEVRDILKDKLGGVFRAVMGK